MLRNVVDRLVKLIGSTSTAYLRVLYALVDKRHIRLFPPLRPCRCRLPKERETENKSRVVEAGSSSSCFAFPLARLPSHPGPARHFVSATMASLARSSARLLRSSSASITQRGQLSRSTSSIIVNNKTQQASSLHTSSRLQNIKDKKITEEEARQIAATHHHGRAQQMSQTPAVDLMTGEMVMQADIDVGIVHSK